MRNYINGFRSEYLKAMLDLPIEVQSRLAFRDLLENGRAVGMISSVYRSGIEFRIDGGDDHVTKSYTNPVINILLPMHLPPRRTKYGAAIGPGTSLTFEQCTFEKGAPVLCDGGTAFLWRCDLQGSSALGMSGLKAEVVAANSDIGEGFGRRRIAYARLIGSNSSELWTGSLGRSDAQKSLLRAQVEHLLNQGKHAPFRQLTEMAVLILGDFSADGRERLKSLRSLISNEGYQPTFVDEIEDVPQHSLHTKVVTLASVCRFVVVDDSSRSGHLTEIGLLRNVDTPIIHLQEEGSDTSSMTLGLDFRGSHFLTRTYTDASLRLILHDCVQWAEQRIRDTEKQFNEVYRSWRQLPRLEDGPLYGLSPFVPLSAH